MALICAVASIILISQDVDRFLVVVCPANPLNTLFDIPDTVMLYLLTMDARNKVQLFPVSSTCYRMSINEY